MQTRTLSFMHTSQVMPLQNTAPAVVLFSQVTLLLLLLWWAPARWSLQQHLSNHLPHAKHPLPVHLTHTLTQQNLWAQLQQEQDDLPDLPVLVPGWQPTLKKNERLRPRPSLLPNNRKARGLPPPIVLHSKKQLDAP